MVFSYPNFPVYNGSISQMIISLFLWFIELPLIVIGNIIITIGGSVANSAGSTASSVISFPGAIFQQTESSFSAYGVFAPVIASVIWGTSIIILSFMVIKAVQISADELTNME